MAEAKRDRRDEKDRPPRDFDPYTGAPLGYQARKLRDIAEAVATIRNWVVIWSIVWLVVAVLVVGRLIAAGG